MAIMMKCIIYKNRVTPVFHMDLIRRYVDDTRDYESTKDKIKEILTIV